MGAYASDNAQCEKVVRQAANGRRLSVENFDQENVDKLIKICQYFPCQNFAPYGITLWLCYVCHLTLI